jgi:hypothetical protein
MKIKSKKFIVPVLIFILFAVLLFPKFLEASEEEMDDGSGNMLTGRFFGEDFLKKLGFLGGGRASTIKVEYKLVIPYSVREIGNGVFNKNRYAQKLAVQFNKEVLKYGSGSYGPAENLLNSYLKSTYPSKRIDFIKDNKDPIVYINLDEESEYGQHFVDYTIKEGPNSGDQILCPKSLEDIRTFVKKIVNKVPDAISKDDAVSVFLFKDLYCMDNPNENVESELAWAVMGSEGKSMEEYGYIIFNMMENLNSEREKDLGKNKIYSVPALFAHEFLHLVGLGHYTDAKYINIMQPIALTVEQVKTSKMSVIQACLLLSRWVINDVRVEFYNGEPGFLYEELGTLDDPYCGNGFHEAYYYDSGPRKDHLMIEGCERNFYTQENSIHYCVKCLDDKGKPLAYPEEATGLKSDNICNEEWGEEWKGCRCHVDGCEPVPPKKGEEGYDLCEGKCWADNDCVSVTKLSEYYWPGLDCICAPPCEESTKQDGCFGYCDVGNKCGPNPDLEVQDDSCYCRDCVFGTSSGSGRLTDQCDSMGNYGCEGDGLGNEVVCERGMTTLYSDSVCMCMLNENGGSSKNNGRKGRNDCGDGVVDGGEECDPPGSGVICDCDGYGACSGTRFLGVCDQTCSEDCSESPGANPYQTYCRTNADCPSSMECVMYNTPSDPCLVGCGFCRIKAQHII